MIIREKLKEQMQRARMVAFGFWLLFAAGMFLPDSLGAVRILNFIPFLGFGGSVLYIMFYVKCPKCGARLGQSLSSISKPNFCPGCGVSFDNPV